MLVTGNWQHSETRNISSPQSIFEENPPIPSIVFSPITLPQIAWISRNNSFENDKVPVATHFAPFHAAFISFQANLNGHITVFPKNLQEYKLGVVDNLQWQ